MANAQLKRETAEETVERVNIALREGYRPQGQTGAQSNRPHGRADGRAETGKLGRLGMEPRQRRNAPNYSSLSPLPTREARRSRSAIIAFAMALLYLTYPLF